MGIYQKHILPKIINWTCSQSSTMQQRRKVVPFASGKVLEVGVGTGLNLPLYDSGKVTDITGLDPSADMWRNRQIEVSELSVPFRFLLGSAEELPFEAGTFDTVLITYTLCSIPHPGIAIREFSRVLSPGGRLIFCEHGQAPDPRIRGFQNLINPLWRHLGGGCNLNRDIPGLLAGNGLELGTLEQMYIPGWKPASFNYWGTAKVQK